MKYDFPYGIRTIPPKTISYYFLISEGRENKKKKQHSHEFVQISIVK